jgi:hypothetical protein
VKEIVLTKIVFGLIKDKFQVSPSLVRFFKFVVYFKSKRITQTSQENSILKSFKKNPRLGVLVIKKILHFSYHFFMS